MLEHHHALTQALGTGGADIIGAEHLDHAGARQAGVQREVYDRERSRRQHQVVRDVEGVWFTSHLNENPREIETVNELFGPGYDDYLDCYDQHGLLGERSVLAHDVHPTDRELQRLAATGTVISHCPTSNASLGSASGSV